MKLDVQKRIVADLSGGVSKKRVVFDETRLEEIKEAITKSDLRSLIKDKAIKVKPVHGTSRVRARLLEEQKRKGRKKGQGSRKGKSTARLPDKNKWMIKVRALKAMIKVLRDKELVTTGTYRNLYMKVKGGFFRSKRHLRLYIDEQQLIKKERK